jgi:hypothetical protein
MAESDFWQALSDTIHRAVNLRVVTLVGDAVVTGSWNSYRSRRRPRHRVHS